MPNISKKHGQLSDSERDIKLSKNKKLEVAIGGIFIVLGLMNFVLTILNRADLSFLSVGITVGTFALLLLLLSQGVSYTKNRLAPIDEYERASESVAKVKAYNYLSAGIIFIIIFSPNEWVVPLLYVLLGATMVVAARVESHGE
jgi:hypothetical protein